MHRLSCTSILWMIHSCSKCIVYKQYWICSKLRSKLNRRNSILEEHCMNLLSCTYWLMRLLHFRLMFANTDPVIAPEALKIDAPRCCESERMEVGKPRRGGEGGREWEERSHNLFPKNGSRVRCQVCSSEITYHRYRMHASSSPFHFLSHSPHVHKSASQPQRFSLEAFIHLCEREKVVKIQNDL